MAVTFTRTYPNAFAAKVLPALRSEAKRIEGHPRVQAALASRGATTADGIYQIDSVPDKEQVGLLFDFFIFKSYRRWKVESDQEAAAVAAEVDADGTYEDGGAA